MPETCENGLGLLNIYVYYAPNLWNLPGTALLAGFQSSHGALKSTSKTVLSKCSLLWIKDLQTSEMTIKIENNFYVGPVNIFLKFSTL